jgi:hypothetical protein
MEEEDVKAKDERMNVMRDIVEEGHKEVEKLLKGGAMDEAWDRLIATADASIRAAKREPGSQEEEKKAEEEEQRCKQRWPMKFRERNVLAPIAETMGMATATDAMVGKRRNQVRRLEEAVVKGRISEDQNTAADIRTKKKQELEQLMVKIKSCAEEEECIREAFKEWESQAAATEVEGTKKRVEDLLRITQKKCESKEKERCKERYKREKERHTQGRGGAWKLMQGGAAGKTAAIRRKDGSLTSIPREMLAEATEYWKGILNQEREFDSEAYQEEYKEEFERIHGEEVQLRKLDEGDFLCAVKRMRKTSSPGVDGMTIAELRWLTPAFWKTVALIFNTIEEEGLRWPAQLLKARLVLIPKASEEEADGEEGKEGGVRRVDKMRPITVMQTIFRLWSSAKYRLLKGWIREKVPAAIISGKPGGEAATIVVELALKMEEALAGLEEEEVMLVTTDFSKFFDCIPWRLVHVIGETMGLPRSLLTMYKSLYAGMERHICIDKWTSEEAIVASNGVIQGDALSLLWAALALTVWVTRIQTRCEGIETKVFVDDRYLIGGGGTDMQDALWETARHDRMAGFILNAKKCTSTATTARGRTRLSKMTMDAEKIKSVGAFKALGHTLAGTRRKIHGVIKTRIKKAMSAATRIKRLKMPSRKQKAEGAMGLVMPRAAYGAWLTRMPINAKRPLATTMMSMAWGIRGGRLRAKEMLNSLVLHTHRVDPDDVMDYQTLLTGSRLMRRNTDLGRRIGRLISHLQGGGAKKYDGPFPVKRLLEVMGRLNAEVDEELNVRHADVPTFNLASVHPGWLGHTARYLIRRSLWERLAARAAKGERSDFVGLQPIDVAATTETIRKEIGGGLKRRTLEMLVTGAVPTWQRCVKHNLSPLEGYAPPSTGICPFCRCGALEDMEHILWNCEAWKEPRERMSEELRRWRIKEEELSRITRNQGIIFEDQDLLRWRKEVVRQEWEYEECPMPRWREEQEEKEEDEKVIVTEEGRKVVFTDGSCLEQSDERIRSAGCGVFVAQNHAWNVGFPLPGVVQSSELGEARAALHVLEAATVQRIDVEIRLDNEMVVNTLQQIVRGEEVEYEKGSNIWKRATEAIRRRKEDGGVGHAVVWIPGHTSAEDERSGKISEENRKGNEEVDGLAKKGAAESACPKQLMEGARKRKMTGKVLHNGFAEILTSRRKAIKDANKTQEEEEEPEDPWASQQQGPRTNKLGLRRLNKRKPEITEVKAQDKRQEETVMRVMWPDYPWQQNEAKYTRKREAEYKGDTRKQAPVEDDAMKAIRWYWNQLRWRDDEEEVMEDKGVSWKELAIDCWAATGCVIRCPRSKGKMTTAQQMSEAFAKASRHIEAEEKEAGGWLWRATTGRTSSLAPFGQRAAVAGLSRRPLLVMNAAVGRVLCRTAEKRDHGAEEEKVEAWCRDEPPTWKRWRDATAALNRGKAAAAPF